MSRANDTSMRRKAGAIGLLVCTALGVGTFGLAQGAGEPPGRSGAFISAGDARVDVWENPGDATTWFALAGEQFVIGVSGGRFEQTTPDLQVDTYSDASVAWRRAEKIFGVTKAKVDAALKAGPRVVPPGWVKRAESRVDSTAPGFGTASELQATQHYGRDVAGMAGATGAFWWAGPTLLGLGLADSTYMRYRGELAGDVSAWSATYSDNLDDPGAGKRFVSVLSAPSDSAQGKRLSSFLGAERVTMAGYSVSSPSPNDLVVDARGSIVLVSASWTPTASEWTDAVGALRPVR